MKTRRAILVTWNPDKFVWGGGYLDAVEQTAQGIALVGDWSTGNRTGGVTRGDRVFLLRQGTQGRGIIASGTVLKDISSDVHWDGSGRQANFVDVIWECVVPLQIGLKRTFSSASFLNSTGDFKAAEYSSSQN